MSICYGYLLEKKKEGELTQIKVAAIKGDMEHAHMRKIMFLITKDNIDDKKICDLIFYKSANPRKRVCEDDEVIMLDSTKSCPLDEDFCFTLKSITLSRKFTPGDPNYIINKFWGPLDFVCPEKLEAGKCYHLEVQMVWRRDIWYALEVVHAAEIHKKK